jgi:hypothetical protein
MGGLEKNEQLGTGFTEKRKKEKAKEDRINRIKRLD